MLKWGSLFLVPCNTPCHLPNGSTWDLGPVIGWLYKRKNFLFQVSNTRRLHSAFYKGVHPTDWLISTHSLYRGKKFPHSLQSWNYKTRHQLITWGARELESWDWTKPFSRPLDYLHFQLWIFSFKSRRVLGSVNIQQAYCEGIRSLSSVAQVSRLLVPATLN